MRCFTFSHLPVISRAEPPLSLLAVFPPAHVVAHSSVFWTAALWEQQSPHPSHGPQAAEHLCTLLAPVGIQEWELDAGQL